MYEFAVAPAITQLRRPGVTITNVEPGSLGEELGLNPTDRIVKVNGHQVRDYLDFRFQTAGETELVFLVSKGTGERVEIEFDREENEDFGLEFEQIVPRQCANECIFCFCKGNPQDARPSLFIRDEDIRLSFLYGNYTTLTSITNDEMRRIIEQRLSPQYVSIHSTDLKTRAYLLGVNEERADISGKLKTLIDNGIEIHAQVVLCPGINDGEILEKTLRDLARFYPKVISVAIVPVALTRYNTDERLTRVTPDFCRRTINQIRKLQTGFKRLLGTNFAFLGDEIYIKAGYPIPSRNHYGNYPQIEDGVGMVRSFLQKFERLFRSRNLPAVRICQNSPRTHFFAIRPHADNPEFSVSELAADSYGTIMTGEMFAPILTKAINRFNNMFGTRLSVLSVPNGYFGGDVSVAGLLSGRDFLSVRENVQGNFAIIPQHVIKSDEPVLIDGMSFDKLQDSFHVPLIPTDVDGLVSLLSSIKQTSCFSFPSE
ncbi:MAG: DUF512 domain-containing protein [Pyrinomonadaceae bacterium]